MIGGNKSSEYRKLPDAYADLVAKDRWVCWKSTNGKKVPYSAAKPSKLINALSPSNWLSHNDSMAAVSQGHFTGVGFVLNGDGIVAIDLDDCVEDGCIEQAAMDIMQELGCGLIEISPSGTGLHGFGYGPQLRAGVLGQYKGISVELYSNRRFITITGQVVMGEGLHKLNGFGQIANAIGGKLTEVTEATEVTESRGGGRCSSPSSLDTLEIPSSCIPRQYGTRNNCIFRLACYLKSLYPAANADDLIPVVRNWHLLALAGMRTKDFEESWVDFKVAWKKSTHVHGASLESALADLPEVPPSMIRKNYGPRTVQLIRICLALQRFATKTPFFLGCRKAGELIGVSHTAAANFLQMLVDDGILTLVSKGGGQLASRYQTHQL